MNNKARYLVGAIESFDLTATKKIWTCDIAYIDMDGKIHLQYITANTKQALKNDIKKMKKFFTS